MPDVLSPAERAAIAAYRGPVQQIPRGVMVDVVQPEGGPTQSHGAHMRRLRERDFRIMIRGRRFQALKAREERAERVLALPAPAPMLVQVSPPTVPVAPKPAAPARERAPRKRAPAAAVVRDAVAAARRAKVREMTLAGMSWSEVRRALGIGRSTMANDMNALRKAGAVPLPKATPAEREAAATERRKRVRDLVLAGRTRQQIAAETGIAFSTVRDCIAALRMCGDLPAVAARKAAAPRPPARMSPAERRHAVLKLTLEGASRATIARELGFSMGSIDADLAALRKAGDLPLGRRS